MNCTHDLPSGAGLAAVLRVAPHGREFYSEGQRKGPLCCDPGPMLLGGYGTVACNLFPHTVLLYKRVRAKDGFGAAFAAD